MPILKNLTELSERIGAGTADFSDKLAEGVRGFACGIWESFPDQVTNNSQLAGSFTRGYMNRMCADKTLSAAPTSTMTPGQCPTQYLITLDVRVARNNAFQGVTVGQIIQANTINASHLGPVVDLEIPPFSQDVPITVKALNEPGNIALPYFYQGGQIRWSVVDGLDLAIADVFVSEITGVSYARVDGMPDDCAITEPSYPQTIPMPADYMTDIVINTEDGDDLTFPLIYTPINFSFPMNFDLGGIKVRIDLGGINFNFSLVSIDGIPVPLPDGQENPLITPGDDENRSFNCKKRLPPNNTNYDEDDKTPTDPKEEDVGEELEFVRVELTTIPANAKTQWGDGAPDVIYAGWFEFKGEGYNFPRQPIHFANSLFASPEGSTGYAYTLRQGFQGKATVFTTTLEI